mmetsp:Transcript_15845/g.48106  ORF Transcript_15845/g.48106 Transcript_15845/m.48106 type:complete len:243 (+) Transcript_15845:1315-2043(+)
MWLALSLRMPMSPRSPCAGARGMSCCVPSPRKSSRGGPRMHLQARQCESLLVVGILAVILRTLRRRPRTRPPPIRGQLLRSLSPAFRHPRVQLHRCGCPECVNSTMERRGIRPIARGPRSTRPSWALVALASQGPYGHRHAASYRPLPLPLRRSLHPLSLRLGSKSERHLREVSLGAATHCPSRCRTSPRYWAAPTPRQFSHETHDKSRLRGRYLHCHYRSGRCSPLVWVGYVRHRHGAEST